MPGAGVDDTPVTIPPPEVTVAMAGLPLLQVPEGVAELRVVVFPWHMVRVPVIFAGIGNTVNTLVVTQPPVVVYVIVAVPGAGVADTPVTTPPPVVILAIAGVLLAHVPPADGGVNVTLKPWHTDVGPVIGADAGVTVIVTAEEHPAPTE